MVTNYQKGQKKEYKIIIREGYSLRAPTPDKIAIRSAGSHSAVDLILIDTKERTIKFVQSKPDSMSDNARNKILEENTGLNGSFFCRFEVI